MRSTLLKYILRTAALAGASLLVNAGVSSAAAVDVYLQTESYTKTLPDGATTPMWRFVCDPDEAPNPSCVPSAGSARINVAAGDDLTIHLDNTLLTPVSIWIPGQTQVDAGIPVPFFDGLGRERVQSFTEEAPPAADGINGSSMYEWSALRAGTYLYQSGTHPSIQVPMGLFGALVVGPATGADCPSSQAAYDSADSCYDTDAVLLFSEIDPVQNAAVEAAKGDAAGYPSTVAYNPTYFLVNGESAAELPAGDDTGQSVLLRFLNAGLRSHTPSIVGLQMGLIAEDSYVYPGSVKRQSAVLLAAGKTLDALVDMPAGDATYALFDRMPTFTNANLPDSVLVADLIVGAGSGTPPAPTTYAEDDIYDVVEDTALIGAASVLSNDVGLAGATVTVVSGPSNGTLHMYANGTFDYTPNGNFSGADGFTYSAELSGSAYPAQVTLNVSFVNDAPVANDDGPYVNTIGTTITVAAPGVLGNDSDPDGDTLTAVIEGTAPAGLTLNADGSFEYTGGTAVTFSYRADDGTLQSDPATVTLTINPVANIALLVQDPGGAAVPSYRWIVQEDATYAVDPAAPPAPIDMLSLNFHSSYMPVVAQGCIAPVADAPPSAADPCQSGIENVPVASFNLVALDPARRYYVSVLPNDAGGGEGHSIGGASIPVGAADTTVTVIVNNQPIPTAQVSVLVFEDNYPTNGAPDGPEPGLGGFQITLEDAGGRYGMSGGPMMQDAFGNPLRNSLDCFGGNDPPTGVILTCPDGRALIKDLPPGKYGVVAVAPAGQNFWVQTSTIEGTKVIDAWVKAGEPPFMLEFGGAGPHAFIGFVDPGSTTLPTADIATSTITGNVTLLHDARPPTAPGLVDSGSYDGLAHTRAWVGLNSSAGDGPSVATVHAEPDGSFTITGIPDGTYQLVIWDDYLDQVIAFQTVTLPGDGPVVDVGNVPVNAWFSRQEHTVFLDMNGDGVRDPDEPGLPEQAVNIRWRDGTMNQSFPTDTEGFVPFDELFPFFAWQVAEVDYTRFKPTGVTVTVDGGGDVSGGPYPGLLNPQEGSPRTDTEPAPVLLEAFQGFPGQTSIFEWGKRPYEPGENGGISGIVFYSSTRGENDPRLTVGDPWEPGVPRVKVRLFREVATSEGGTALALVEEVETDSWDASLPEGCPGEDPSDPFTTQTLGAENLTRCYDGWRNWNQVRPGVFDGGYAFTDIPPGKYVVEVVPPPGYQLVKEEDVNVGFGDAFAMAPVPMMLPGGGMPVMPDQAMVLAAMGPEPGLAQPKCAGEEREVPAYLSLFPSEMIEAPFAGALRPLCNRKQVILSDQGQAAADFHLFTSTPVAAQFAGLITDDIATESNPASPGFGEKWSPAYLPFSIRDFRGQEVFRGYSDAFGRYNGVLPSTFTANIPIPSGYSPSMMAACLNDPGDGSTIDPLFNPVYGIYCYTMQFMPGATTYLDTPILPTAAFAAGFNPADCEPVDGAPLVQEVVIPGSGPGPWTGTGSATINIIARGEAEVPNPAYEGPLAPAPYNQPTITRNFNFGTTAGTVTFGGVPLTVTQWKQNIIKATLPACAAPPCTGQIVVTRGDNGETSIDAAVVTQSDETPIQVLEGGSIQAAIDAAAPGDLILVEPGLYEEMVVMWKPVRLQGSGAGVTLINALKRPTEKLEAWSQKVQDLIDSGQVDVLPGQALVDALGTEQGAGVTVLAKADNSLNSSFSNYPSRIDGFTITGADIGGGIFVNGYAHNLEISNNRITGNSGFLHGGIRVGRPSLVGDNTNIYIHHNVITRNGAIGEQSTGGGVELSAGSDEYTVSSNFICGNVTLGDGAGIGHLGLSDGGRIESNKILFNQSINQGLNKNGGGIFIAGEPSEPPALTLGTGNVVIDANLVQGNTAAHGHGAGIRTQLVNGEDVVDGAPWSLEMTNNVIVNNVAGWSGAGVSLQDTINASIINNTIANNDTTATAGGLIVANVSTPQPAGISAERHSLALAAVVEDEFSNPELVNNIVWHNRAFHYDATGATALLIPDLNSTAIGECPAGANHWDLGVLGEPKLDPALQLDPTYSILTDTTGYAGSNLSGDPLLVSGYCNGARTLSTPGPMAPLPAFQEGGNYIDVRYGPLTQAWPAGSAPWNYHLGSSSSPALNSGDNSVAPDHDYDGDVRPLEGQVERGADEAGRGTVAYTSATPPAQLTNGNTTLDFGTINGNSTRTSTVTLTVGGGLPVTFGSLTVTNTAGTAFSKGTDTCSGATVPVGGTCTVDVRFNVAGSTLKTGTLSAPHNGAGSPNNLALRGI